MTTTLPVATHPGLSAPLAPHVPLRAEIARLLFARAVRRLPLRVELEGGLPLADGPPGAPVMRIRSRRMFDRLGVAGKIGFGEAYMAGEWDSDDLPGVLAAFAGDIERLVPRPLQALRGLFEPRRPVAERNTPQGSARNIERHYDLSNELFALFLDETMTYSCAVFEPGDSLARAQTRKYEALATLARLGPEHHVLEIGGGWGGMAIHAAATRGCRVTMATISQRQLDLARERVARAGLSDRVEVVLCDYRELRGCYDRIISIEMFEAVGEEYWPGFFATCDRLLAPGGSVAMQVITMPHRRHRASRRSYTWMHKYVFPGGTIPSSEAIDAALAARSRLRVERRIEIGAHYETTLRHWRERFLARRHEVLELGFTETFVRTWEFYLAYCEAGFRARALGDQQLLLTRGGA
jgi:cyclopropane-fatty-acyl-phospholipid synthase